MDDFEKIKQIVDKEIRKFEDSPFCSTNHIRSEADFERLLSNQIENSLPRGYAIHNQISYYGHNNALKYRVDAVVMKTERIESPEMGHKGFCYKGESIPIELKFYRKSDPVNSIRKDLEKTNAYMSSNSKAFLFVVALLEKDDGKSDKIHSIENEYRNKNYSVIILHQKNNQ